MLNKVGFSLGSIDGIFWYTAESVVVNFRGYSNMAVDGLAGKQTYSALIKELSKSIVTIRK